MSVYLCNICQSSTFVGLTPLFTCTWVGFYAGLSGRICVYRFVLNEYTSILESWCLSICARVGPYADFLLFFWKSLGLSRRIKRVHQYVSSLSICAPLHWALRWFVWKSLGLFHRIERVHHYLSPLSICARVWLYASLYGKIWVDK